MISAARNARTGWVSGNPHPQIARLDVREECASMGAMRVEELDFDLPEELIAQAPLEKRSASRLLVVDRQEGHMHRQVAELPALLPPSLFVVNETRVLRARLRGQKETGGRCELLLVEPLASGEGGVWSCLGTANKPLKAGTVMRFGAHRAVIEERREGGELHVRFEGDAESFEAMLQNEGEMPLPPYIRRTPDEDDDERYQTVFARLPGAVAAPTAGLHFDEALLAAMRKAGHRIAKVALHVGPGTFRPVKVDDLDAHPMHAEHYVVSEETAAAIDGARGEGRDIVAVGTTVVRTLEAAADGDRVLPGESSTSLFIQPGYAPKVVDHLFTNFHLPRSTLLALVMAFGGQETIANAYRAAVAERYRFFSYGDAMLIRNVRTAPASS